MIEPKDPACDNIQDANGISRPAFRSSRAAIDADVTSRNNQAMAESTRDPIFLFQVRVVDCVDPEALEISDTYHDGDSLWVNAERFTQEEILQAAKDEDIILKRDEDDLPFDMGIRGSDSVMQENHWVKWHWDTRDVFRTREEGVAYGMRHAHDHGTMNIGWQVYCIPCDGELATILRHVDRKELVDFVQSQSFSSALGAWRAGLIKKPA